MFSLLLFSPSQQVGIRAAGRNIIETVSRTQFVAFLNNPGHSYLVGSFRVNKL